MAQSDQCSYVLRAVAVVTMCIQLLPVHMQGRDMRADPGKGPLLLGLAVGLSLQLGYNTPPPGQSFFCCCNFLPLPHL